MRNQTVSQHGTGPLTILFLVFLVLKLCKVIAWSWWWVFSPVWIPLVLIALVLLGVGVWSIFKK